MERITINNKAYNIPTNWEEMNFGQFLKLSDYLKGIAEEEEYDDNIFYCNLIGILTNGVENSINKVNLTDLPKFKTAVKFVSTKFNNATYSNRLEHNGLIIKIKNFEKLNFGEYTDLMHMSNVKSQYDLIKLLSFMCDIHQKKDIKKLRFRETQLNFSNDEKELIIKTLPATKANAVSSFFLHGQKQSQRSMVSSLHLVVMRLTMKAFSQTVGLIISGLWMRVMRILLSLAMLLTFRLDKSLLIWRTKLPRII
jgi:hypothetical protein